jgi:hypothetical protein
MTFKGHAIAQAISHRLPTTAGRVRAQVRSRGICDGQSGTEAGFLRVLRFPLPIIIQSTAPHSSPSTIRGWYNRPVSGRRTKRTQSHFTPSIIKKRPLQGRLSVFRAATRSLQQTATSSLVTLYHVTGEYLQQNSSSWGWCSPLK